MGVGPQWEIFVDCFAGGGGVSVGAERAVGKVHVAINHSPQALAIHRANHPHTEHFEQSITSIDPLMATRYRPVGGAWFSPDCKHFSKAKGGKPVSKHIRDLAWVVVHWAERVRPRVIFVENVEEFQTWGPLGPDGRPCKAQSGLTFRRWVKALKRLGYVVEWRELRACDYGTPTTRKRLFLIARCDGRPIVWPEPTHGPGLIPYRTAAECIDWSLPTRSIFNRKRPLAEATMRRIARGVWRYVIEAERPFIVPLTHHGKRKNHDLNEPFRTVTAANRGELALVQPHLMVNTTGHSGAHTGEPLQDILSRDPKPYGHHGLVWCLEAHQDIGRIFPYCVEILGRPSSTGERSRLHYTRGEPSAMLVALHGREAIFPKELRKVGR